MKFVLLYLILCAQAFAAITPEEKKEALGQTKEVIQKIIGERGEAKVLSARVVDEFGTRLNVEIAFVEDMSGAKKCSYSYDRVLKRVLADSWTCDI
jgi:hypothetical protein